MDGNNVGNNQYGNNGSQNNQGQSGNYQDYTGNNTYYQPPVNNNNSDGKASGKQVAGLVFGILAICFSCCLGIPGIIFGIVGLILSIMGNKESQSGVGVAGLVCSIIGLICGIAMTIYWAYSFVLAFQLIESGEYENFMNYYSNFY